MIKIFKKEKKEPENLKELLNQFNDLKKDFQEITLRFENLEKESYSSIQKVAMVRFNPFKQIGGDQSFSIALLDGKNNGLVITSFYSRETNRIYSKPIKNGKSQYNLSKEELKVIKLAIEKKEKDESTNNKNQTANSSGAGSY